MIGTNPRLVVLSVVRLLRGSWMVLLLLSAAATSCSSVEVGERIDLDEDEISKDLHSDGFVVPEGFDFAQAHKSSEFVGKPARWARYDASADLGDGSAVATANPSYPPMQPISCSSVPPGSWVSLGFVCLPGTLSTQYPPAGGPDTVTVLLTEDAHGAHLFVYSSGH